MPPAIRPRRCSAGGRTACAQSRRTERPSDIGLRDGAEIERMAKGARCNCRSPAMACGNGPTLPANQSPGASGAYQHCVQLLLGWSCGSFLMNRLTELLESFAARPHRRAAAEG
jgi:hypothetical protein